MHRLHSPAADTEPSGGRRRYPDDAKARRHAVYLNRARPKSPGVFLAAFGGMLPRHERDDSRR